MLNSLKASELREKIKGLNTKVDEFFPVKKETTKEIIPKEKQLKLVTNGKDFQR